MSRQHHERRRGAFSFVRRQLTPVFAVIGILIGLATAGCGTPGTGIEVSGTVTSNGQPVENGTILFVPDQNMPGQSGGGTIKGGHFVVKAMHGLQEGQYVVTVTLGGVPTRKEGFEKSGKKSSKQAESFKFTHSITRDNPHIDIELERL